MIMATAAAEETVTQTTTTSCVAAAETMFPTDSVNRQFPVCLCGVDGRNSEGGDRQADGHCSISCGHPIIHDDCDASKLLGETSKRTWDCSSTNELATSPTSLQCIQCVSCQTDCISNFGSIQRSLIKRVSDRFLNDLISSMQLKLETAPVGSHDTIDTLFWTVTSDSRLWSSSAQQQQLQQLHGNERSRRKQARGSGTFYNSYSTTVAFNSREGGSKGHTI